MHLLSNRNSYLSEETYAHAKFLLLSSFTLSQNPFSPHTRKIQTSSKGERSVIVDVSKKRLMYSSFDLCQPLDGCYKMFKMRLVITLLPLRSIFQKI